MKRYLCLALALAAIIAFSTTDAFARGGHGGGHHGGGHHGGRHGGHHGHHSHHSHHSSHHHSHHHSHTHHHVGSHGNHAFSHGWGAGRGAWGWGGGGYGWGNPWAAASYGAAAGWLGLSALDAAGVVAEQPVNNGTTEIVNDTPAADDVADNSNVADASDDADDDSDEPVTQPENAAALAATGATDPGKQAKFLPLGVYSIAPEGETEAAALIHLAVSKEGTLRGTYYDLKTDKTQNLRGAVDKQDHSVAWTIDGEPKAVFHTWLEDLTEQSGPVTEKTDNGQTRVLTIARYTEEDRKKSEEENGKPAETNKPA